MNILYICRLYSGFEESLRSGQWAPSGSPTIARMIERLDGRDDVRLTLVMNDQDYNSSWGSARDEVLSVDGLSTGIHVLAGRRVFAKFLGPLRSKLSALRHLWEIVRIARRVQPDVIYCDRVNSVAGAMFARFTKTPVIWRVMGVLETMRADERRQSLYSRFFRWVWRSPFTAIICTLDGSGGEPWLSRIKHPKTDVHMMVNGTDLEMKIEPVDLPKMGVPRILVAGRIEDLKGLDQMITAFDRLKQNGADFHICVAGYGSREDWFRSQIEAHGLSGHVHFCGRLTPAQMKYVRGVSDIYLSCNTHGNLTNTVIEALSDGLCTVLPAPSVDIGVDVDTIRFVPAGAAHFYGAQDDVGSLSDSLNLLLNDEKKRALYGEEAKRFAAQEFPSWDKRIEREHDLLRSLARREGS